MGLDLRPLLVVAANEELVEALALVALFQVVGNRLEVLRGLVQYAALGVSGIVAAEAVALAVPREFIKEVHLLGDFVADDLEDTSLGAVGEDHQASCDPRATTPPEA